MASINVMEIIKAEFAEAALRIQARLTGTDGAAVLKVSGKKVKAEKKVSARKGAPTVRGDFTKKLLEERKAEVEAFKAKMKEEQPEQKGAHLVFVSKYIEEHAEEYAAFKSAWEVAHPKPEKGAPAASDSASEAGSESGSEGAPAPAEGGEKKKRVLSEEHKAKMQAARKAKKAEKEAAKAAEEAAAKSEGEEAAPAEAAAPKAKKAPKKATRAADAGASPTEKATAPPEPTPAPAPPAPAREVEEAESDDEEGPEFQSFVLGKTKYFRLGNRRPDGSVIWATGDLWENNKGARGDYVGLLGEDGAIDTSAEEPDLE